MALELWRPTLPAWRRAAERATMTVRARGGMPPDAPSWLEPASEDSLDASALLIDDAQLVMTSVKGRASPASGPRTRWSCSSHGGRYGALCCASFCSRAACSAAPIPESQQYPPALRFALSTEPSIARGCA